ncbi:uncharacterized protein LOC124268186 isoform X2 [Haliotis rubra]|uniref:uncharacterized protein LOC124268186 isoform X2 n=1 Tax=Haliotis rubra TaxID=36100 RepID=UPI001EE50E53|nr:uncharacterized protein LOC124268186 isoform X2 [Haliotis rubra]
MFLSKALQLHFGPGNAVIDTKAPLNWFMRTSINQVWPPDLVRGQAWHNNCPLNIFYFGPGNMGNDNKHRPSRCARPPHPVRGEHKPGLLKIRRLATVRGQLTP